jgi:hypothetical protein
MSCKKQQQDLEQASQIEIGSLVRNYILAKESEVDGVISITSRNPSGYRNSGILPDMTVDAKFYSDRSKLKHTSIGNFTIEDLQIPFYNSVDNAGYYIHSLSSTAAVQKKLLALFGRKIIFTIGNSLALTTNGSSSSVSNNSFESNGFYVPSNISITGEFVENYYLNLNSDNLVSWIPDANNPAGTIIIGIIKESNFDSSSGYPAEVIYFEEIPDNGNFIITPTILQSLATNSRATVFVARGNYEIISDPQTSSQILCEALTYSTLPFLGVR